MDGHRPKAINNRPPIVGDVCVNRPTTDGFTRNTSALMCPIRDPQQLIRECK